MMTFTTWLIKKNLIRKFWGFKGIPKVDAQQANGQYDKDLAFFLNGFYKEVVVPAVARLPQSLKQGVQRRFDFVRHDRDLGTSPFLFEDLQQRLDRFVRESQRDVNWQPGQPAHWLELRKGQSRYPTLVVQEPYRGRQDPTYVGEQGITGASGDPVGGQVSDAPSPHLPPPKHLVVNARCLANFRNAAVGTAFLGLVKIGERTGSAVDEVFLVAVRPLFKHITDIHAPGQDLGPIKHTGNPPGHMALLRLLIDQKLIKVNKSEDVWNGIELYGLSKYRLNETGSLFGFGMVKGTDPPDLHKWEFTSRSMNEYATGKYTKFKGNIQWQKHSPHVPSNWAKAIWLATRRL